MTDIEMQALLRPVARSFALNLRLLPAAMRRPLSLAYLLARLSDTVADASGGDYCRRESLLEALRAHPESVSCDNPGFPVSCTPGEAELWRSWEKLKKSFLGSDFYPQISRVWTRILDGQLNDLQRAQNGTLGEPLQWESLLDYCDSVAGSVGVFWHEIGISIWPGWTSLSDFEARDCARSYGHALQLVNICRDAKADEETGRIYLSTEDRARALGAIDEGLQNGISYAASLSSWRVRWATLLPANLAMELLPAIKDCSPQAKLNRKIVRRVLFQSLWQSLASRRTRRAG